MKRLITQINPLSSHDGTGVRTSIFFKGCSLHCAWCHNPETCSPQQEIMWKRQLCIGCGECMKHCPTGALDLSREQDFMERDLCRACGTCVSHCAAQALSLAAKSYSVEDIAAIILKNEPLFRAMNGGVSFSGGEPALQSDFIVAVIDRLREHSIHYALDTCGCAPWAAYEQLLPHIDLLLFDLKEMDSERHQRYTGAGNEMIHAHLKHIVQMIEAQNLKTKIWIRTPLIPGYTAREQNVKAIAAFLQALDSPAIERWDLCCFNNLCHTKYRQLGEPWALDGVELLRAEEAHEFLAWAKAGAVALDGVEVRLSGLTKRGA